MIDFKDKTHKDFYEMLGISKEAFYKRMRGVTKWKPEEVLKLADYLDTKASVIRLQIKNGGGKIKASETYYRYKDGKFEKVTHEK